MYNQVFLKLVLFSSVVLLLLSSFAYGADIGFAVVAGGYSTSTEVKVIIGSDSYLLRATITDVPFFTGRVNAPTPPFTYKYSVAGVAETFTRTFSSGTQTFNEFYGRQDTVKPLYQLGWPFTTQKQWDRNLGPNGVFDDDYISTLFISGSNATTCFGNAGNNCYGRFPATIISKYDIGTFSSVEISSKAGYEPKIQFNMYLPVTYRGRSVYKLRPSAYDPVFIRENIYNSVLQAMGVPHQETSFTRVYINDKGLGLYNLQEITGSYEFIKTQFYGRNRAEPATYGVPLECSTGADFYPDGIYSFQAPAGYSNARMNSLISAVNSLNPSSDTEIANFDATWFDIDNFLRYMAMEYLTGHWDGYWFFTSNFVMYDDTTENGKFYFIDQDFDQTFGCDIPSSLDGGDEYTSIPYSRFVNRAWGDQGGDAPNRVIIDKLFANTGVRNKFEDILKTTVKSIFNPIALGKRIAEVRDRIRPEVQWDRSLGANRAHQGDPATQATQWTLNHFDQNFANSVNGIDGITDFVTKRATYISTQFSISAYDNPPLSAGNYNYPATSSGYIIPSGTTTSALTSGVTSGALTTMQASTTVAALTTSVNSVTTAIGSTTNNNNPGSSTTATNDGSTSAESSTTGNNNSGSTTGNPELTSGISSSATTATSEQEDDGVNSGSKSVASLILSITLLFLSTLY